MRIIISVSMALLLGAGSVVAQEQSEDSGDKVVMLSTQWGKAACEAWNKDSVLTKGLSESGWISNDKNGRGFRIIEIYRSDCAESPHIQLKFEAKDNLAICVDSGPMFDKEWDFLMYAETKYWVAMGKGDVGPMGGMMTGKLKFSGSMWEAMQNMGPFENFLLLFGKVASTTDTCN